MQIDNTNQEFAVAVDAVFNQRKSLFLTGRAGTGKTHFLKYIREKCNNSKINLAVVAPTGIAALNAGGQTIHSFFKVPYSIFPPDDKRLRTKVPNSDPEKISIYNIFKYNETRKEIIKNLDMLIIDEVSMVRCDMLDIIDKLLRVFRGKDSLPFGGVQVILIGDPFQLPPIVDNKEWDILQQYYKSPWFFSSKIFENITDLIELQKIYRQSDKVFIDILNKVRDGSISYDDLQILNQRYNSTFKNSDKNKKYMNITTHNYIADRVNENELNKIYASASTFKGIVQGKFPKDFPAPLFLTLKKGAQVMMVKNDTNVRYANGSLGDTNVRYANGSLGEILELKDDKITVKLDSGLEIELIRDCWFNIEYVWNVKDKQIEENITGKYFQYPLKLAWCITVHKSQGLTFDYVIADLSSAFATGQVYVALSRCTSLKGLVLKTKISLSAIKTDKNVLEFYNKINNNKI